MPKPPARTRGGSKLQAVSKPGTPALQRPGELVELAPRGHPSPDGLDIEALVETMTSSKSVSPYSSAEMLKDYVENGFPEMPGKIILAIDNQIEHRQKLEVFVTERHEQRETRAQIFAQIIAMLGLIGSLVAAYFGVPTTTCVFVCVMAIGGPNAASVAARIFDRPGRD